MGRRLPRQTAQPPPRLPPNRVAQLTDPARAAPARYQDELTAVDKLKKQKASWRRDRELNTAQADAKDTADKLAALDKQLAARADHGHRRAHRRRQGDRRRGADRDRPARRDPREAPRAARARAEGLQEIVIPDGTLDPLADPDEPRAPGRRDRGQRGRARTSRSRASSRRRTTRSTSPRFASSTSVPATSAMREDDQPHRNAQSLVVEGHVGHARCRGSDRSDGAAGGAGGGASNGHEGSTSGADSSPAIAARATSPRPRSCWARSSTARRSKA